MKNKIKKAYYLIIAAALVSLTTLSFNNPDNFLRKDWIPKDFNPRNCTLLIGKHPYNESYHAGLVKFLSAEYPWKYEIVDVEDYDSDTKYDDKKLYPFILIWVINGQDPDYHTSNFSYKDLDGFFLDRTTTQSYPTSGYGINRGQSAYKKIISSLVKAFEEEKN